MSEEREYRYLGYIVKSVELTLRWSASGNPGLSTRKHIDDLGLFDRDGRGFLLADRRAMRC